MLLRRTSSALSVKPDGSAGDVPINPVELYTDPTHAQRAPCAMTPPDRCRSCRARSSVGALIRSEQAAGVADEGLPDRFDDCYLNLVSDLVGIVKVAQQCREIEVVDGVAQHHVG